MPNYTPFLISELKSGINTYLKPWIRPQDSFEPLVNAHVYRGILQKRNGSTVFGNQLDDINPVMGIMQYQNESSGATILVAASTTDAYEFVSGGTQDSGTFNLLTAIGGTDSIFWEGNVVVATTTIPATGSTPTFWPNLVPTSITVTGYDISTSPPTLKGTTTDDGAGNWTANGIFNATGGGTSIDYTTGEVNFSVTIGGTYPLALKITATVTGGYFTGNITNFFNWSNWQATSSITNISSSYLYMTNGVDPITTFDGVNLARPVLYVDSTYTNYITTALDVKNYANRLILPRPTVTGNANASNQDIAYSALYSPFDFITDVAGHGGALSAATGDRIVSAEFLRDNLIVAFSNSFWSFQNTGLVSPPYIFRKLSVSKSVQCPYAGVAYDERVTNLGNTGFVACDGVNVQRYDLSVIEYYETKIAQKYFNQDYSQRYDNLSQSWMFYPSSDANPNQFPVIDDQAPGSDETLIYNYLENTWATYKNSFPMTCMGVFYVDIGVTWAYLQQAWQDTDSAWNSYGVQSSGRMLLGGDTSGNIYHLDNSLVVKDGVNLNSQPIVDGTPYNVEIKTTRWNPFMQTGQKTQFGYIDVYYSVASVDPTTPIEVTLNFFVDNSNNVALSRTLTLDAPTTSTSEILATGTGAGGAYAGTIGFSIIPNSLLITVTTSKGPESFQDNGLGILLGTLGDAGTINYGTGDWTLNFVAKSVPINNPINGTYTYYRDEAYAWKRIYCNLMGEFIQMEIDPSEDSYFEILGFVLWARPAGRLTP